MTTMPRKVYLRQCNKGRLSEYDLFEVKSLEWLLDLPDDVWKEIFDQLDDPADLLACMLTCTRFNALAIMSLYRSVRYVEHYQAIPSSLPPLAAEIPSNLAQLIRTVVLITHLGDYMGYDDDKYLRLRIKMLYNSTTWFPYNDPATLSSLFPSSYSNNITKLVCNASKLSPTFHLALSSLTNLHSLHFISSYDVQCDSTDASLLSAAVAHLSRLVDLRIWKHNWEVDELRFDGCSGAIDNILFSSQYLETLHLDWCDWSSRVVNAFIQRENKPKHHNRFLSTTLSNLRVLWIRILSEDAAEPGCVENRPTLLYADLGNFLRYCMSLEELHLVVQGGYGIPQFAARAVGYVGLAKLKILSGAPLPLLPLLIPQNAQSFESLNIPHQWILYHPNNRARSVRLRDPSSELISSTFSRIHAPNLKELVIFCEGWHREVLLCVTGCFPCLKSLKVGYDYGVIHESEWISMGGLHLHTLPNLKTFYLYRHEDTHPSEPPPRLPRPASSYPDLELIQDIFAAWDRYVQLDEVSFSHDSVWTRGRVVECASYDTSDGIPRSEWTWSEWTEFRASDVDRHHRLVGEEQGPNTIPLRI
ncbi:hypothetical protein L218DRAFT_1081784 [Marasmius fiardii PR-910]|nr:hypothetical protein L218DRAFT_1081784 [Marasmius fiardii PR-910]